MVLGSRGGGGVLIFGSDGDVPLKPPNLSFWRERVYPLLGVFIQENYVFVYFSDEMGDFFLIYSKITKLHPMFRDFSAKPYPMF